MYTPRFDSERYRSLLAGAGMSPTGRTKKSIVYDCPVCDRRKKLYVRRYDGQFICWGCRDSHGTSGDPEYLLALVTHCSLPAARAQVWGEEAPPLAAHLDIGDLLELDEPDEEEWEILPTCSWTYHHHPIDAPIAAAGAAYLVGRGIPVVVAKEYGVRYSPIERRVAFPVIVDGKLIGWQGRFIGDHRWKDEQGVEREGLKILSTASIPRSRVVMFQDRLRGRDSAILVEGPVDGIKCHLCPAAAAVTMGKTINRGQLEVLRRAGIRRLWVGLDPDAADETHRIIRDFAFDMEVRDMLPAPGREDLGAGTMEENLEQFHTAPRTKPWALRFWIG